MALLQKTLVSGSIWIGSGSGTMWDGYNSSHNYPFAIYQNDNPLLYYNINQNSTGGSLVIPTTTSINSNIYSSGFEGEGFKIFANPKTVDNIQKLFWTGQFDDLWVRGSMHVKQFVIDQIRATNGSLYISDAAAAISASFVGTGNTGTMSLYFQTGSTMPFVANDIIRSKRWIPDGSHGIAHQWDFLAGVTKIGSTSSNGITYNTVSFTTSRTGNNYTNYYYGSGNPNSTVADFASTISVLSSQWVRVGNLSTATGRSGSIYLTSNDSGGPFMDVVSGVNTIIDALGGTSATNSVGGVPSTTSVSQSKLKLRLGNLQGIFDQDFNGQLSGYGMWADNAYLRGWIVANQGGNIAGWKIEPNTLSNLSMKLVANTNTSYIGLGTDTYSGNGIWIGTSSAGSQFSVGNTEDFIRWDGSGFTVSTPNFRIQTGSVSMSGTVSATSGLIGGWTIGTNQLYSGLVTISSLSTNKYFGIGASGYNTASSIYLGSNSVGSQFSIRGTGTTGLYWDGTNLGVTTSNFTLSGGNITAKGGTIAAWSIGADSMSATTALSSLILRNATSSAWNMVDSGGYRYSWQDGPYFNWKGKYFSTGSTYEAAKSPWAAISNTSSVSTGGIGGQTKIGFTVSAAGMDKTLVTWNDFHPDKDKITALPGETIHIIINTMSVANTTNVDGRPSSPFDLLQLNLIEKTHDTTRSVLHSFLLPEIGQTTVYTQNEQIYPGVFATSFTNNSDNGETYSILISVTSSIRGTVGNESLPNFNYNLVIKGLGVGSAKGYTELNSQGLLVYAGPSNFIKISTNQLSGGTSGSNLGIIAVDTIVGGNAAYGYSGGGGTSGGTSGGIDGEGTGGTLSLWQDNNTITDSIISQQNGATVSVAGTISAPAFSGSGFVFAGPTTALSTVGNITSGQDLSDLSIKQILDAMLLYAKPTLTAPTLKYAGSSYYYETGSTIGAGGTIYQASTNLTNYPNLMPGTGLTMSFVRNDESVVLGSKSVAADTTHTVTFTMTAETGSYNSYHATSVKATITNSKGVVTEASRTIYFRAPVFAFTNTQSSFTDTQFVTAIRSTLSNPTITKVNLAKGETYTTPANSSGGTVQAYLAWPASWSFTPSSMKMYGNPCGATLISSTMGYTSSVNPDAKLQYKLLAVGDPQTNPAALSLYIED